MAIARPTAEQSGIILINKPRGITSFGVVSRLRKLTGVRRIGHTGTLDPFADGLLPVCIGRATAAVQFMDGYDKSYRLGIEFGRATDTLDLTGTTVFEHQLTAGELDELRKTNFTALYAAVAALPGDHRQTPPMYSAVKIDGKKLYEYARAGEEIERQARPIRISAAVVEAVTLNDNILRADIRIDCSKGTYIRTIADELGKTLGFGAHAASLTRLRCGPFALGDAQELEQLFAWRAECADQPAFTELLRDKGLLLPVERAFADFPTVHLPESVALRLINGLPMSFDAAELTDWLPDPKRSQTAFLPPIDTDIVAYSRGCLIGIIKLQNNDDGTFRLKSERVLIDLADFRA